jgi:hypothetical protein
MAQPRGKSRLQQAEPGRIGPEAFGAGAGGVERSVEIAILSLLPISNMRMIWPGDGKPANESP